MVTVTFRVDEGRREALTALAQDAEMPVSEVLRIAVDGLWREIEPQIGEVSELAAMEGTPAKFKTTEEQQERLDRIAAHLQVSRSDVIRMALDRVIQRAEQP